MFEAIDIIPREELERRWSRCRTLLSELLPDASGLLVSSRLTGYWLTGSWVNGLVWLPKNGDAVLMARRGLERAEMESTVTHKLPYRSYRDIQGIAAKCGVPMTGVVGVDMGVLPWAMGERLASSLEGARCVAADHVISLARSVKTPWELERQRRCGQQHALALTDVLPQAIRPGMSEQEISRIAWDVFLELGHMGPTRMGNFGEEMFFGHIAAGDNGNYPSTFNGPLGLKGGHPSAPFMGSADSIWEKGQILSCDIGFCLAGYQTDRTQVYFAGTPDEIPAEVQKAHEFCVKVQNWTAENMRPGALPEDLYLHTLEWAKQEGFADGYMGVGQNQVRFLGHGIGLVIDEFPPLAKKVRRPLEEGMVIAVEPKIGIPGVGMVGIENTFEVKADGAVSLTGDCTDILCVTE